MKSNYKELVDAARLARRQAYAPYSHYYVGAAVMTKSGKVYTGCNIENAAYPTSICAERVAIFKAVSDGEREIVALAVATSNGGSPCGACRQALSEFAGDNAVIVLASAQGNVHKTFSMKKILPDRFGPQHLP